ncbi:MULTISPECIES: hypothetical protein [unclassified Ochrobactrum]|uniref:hypothetical protein n=1 Tax=unclassified Ochrobactrum TaxID=239106 RepID=UPI0013B43A6E|nr:MULTISPECIES: hypothetical protein [unclassified Ochrobactrum]MBQ0710092.1 hypothetical protein [Ochrobactrum sp. AP1BH01-1]
MTALIHSPVTLPKSWQFIQADHKKAGSMILPRLRNTCCFFADPDMLCQCFKLQESAYATDIPLLKLWKFLKLLQSGEKCTSVHGFSLHLSGYPQDWC